MSATPIRVFLITGFLGSGKTTFLNRMLKQAPTDIKLMVLMNEFGEQGIDGTLIEDPELKLVEISCGSIFCGCVKNDFIKAMYHIAFDLKPQVLVVEASGVANPSDMDRDLVNPIFKGAFELEEKFCLVDAVYFEEQYNIFTAIEKQIDACSRFIINKMDLADAGAIERIRKVILGHNPSATFVETSYGEVDVAALLNGGATARPPTVPGALEESTPLTMAELDKLIDGMLEDRTAQLDPADWLVSMSFRWIKGTLEDFRYVAMNLPPDVVRAKGFVFEHGSPYLYSHVGQRHEITLFQGPRTIMSMVNRVVFIRRESREDDIRALFSHKGIDLLESSGIIVC